ncbi:MAG: hypothetical protein SGBAC_005000 [Bacillariaceae sp.]
MTQVTGGAANPTFNAAALGMSLGDANAGGINNNNNPNENRNGNGTNGVSGASAVDPFGGIMGGAAQSAAMNSMIQGGTGGIAPNLLMGATAAAVQHQQQQQIQRQQILNLQQSQLASLSVEAFGQVIMANMGNSNNVPNINALGNKMNFQAIFPQVPAMMGGAISQNDNEVKKQSRKESKSKRAKTFPEKLMMALMEDGTEDAIAWLPDGKSFVIVNPDIFCLEVLAKTFKESKYSSFVRKLHRWGFVRLTSGTGTDCFHHPQFQRNKREMAGKIVCVPRDSKEKASDRIVKPPSLAGVEKYIKAKVNQVVGGTRHDGMGGVDPDATSNEMDAKGQQKKRDKKSTTTAADLRAGVRLPSSF